MKNYLSDFAPCRLISQQITSAFRVELFEYQTQSLPFYVREKTLARGKTNRRYSMQIGGNYTPLFNEFIKTNKLKPLCTQF